MSELFQPFDANRQAAAALRDLADGVRLHARRRQVLAEEMHTAWTGPNAERHRLLATDRSVHATALASLLDADADALARRAAP